MENVRILENDGHNMPSFHIFTDLHQAAGYIASDPDEFDEVLEALSEGEYQDDNCVTWTVTDSLYEHDHTSDEEEE